MTTLATLFTTLPDRPILTALLAFTAPVVLLAGRIGTKRQETGQ